MDHSFNVVVAKRHPSGSDIRRNSSCGDIQDLSIQSKKRRSLKRASFSSRPSSANLNSDRTKRMSNSELVDVVDEQLMQIRENLAAFRQQDTRLRERIDSLSGSVNELSSSRSSLSSCAPSECSDLGSLDEVNEEDEQTTTGQVKDTKEHLNRSTVLSFHVRQSSDPSSIQSHEDKAEAIIKAQRCSTYSDQAINLYPQYNNPENISTLF